MAIKDIKKGKFIVIEGIDGSGKRTQTELLVNKLRQEKYKVKTIDFPQYENNFFGKFIGECLAGTHGDFAKLDAKIASVLYAVDRFESGEKIKKWLEQGNTVVIDRYVSSNQIHQGGKISDVKKRREFLSWLEKMEFEVFKIPKPDVVIYLNVPLKISLQLLKNNNNKQKKNYLHGKKDAHESNIEHLVNAERSALSLARSEKRWLKIKCYRNGKLLSKEEIAKMVWREISQIELFGF